MPEPSDQVRAARILLSEVCSLFAAYSSDTVLVGGWVPDVLFPTAVPPHVGSIDVDLAMRLRRTGHTAVVDLLRQNGFHQGKYGYQFFKDIILDGRKVTAQLDLLTSVRHHDEHFAGSTVGPQPIHGADIALRDNAVTLLETNDEVQIRVAGIVAFLVMKSLALFERAKPKDAYDIHFCLEHYPDGLRALGEEFRRFTGDALVEEAKQKLTANFNLTRTTARAWLPMSRESLAMIVRSGS